MCQKQDKRFLIFFRTQETEIPCSYSISYVQIVVNNNENENCKKITLDNGIHHHDDDGNPRDFHISFLIFYFVLFCFICSIILHKSYYDHHHSLIHRIVQFHFIFKSCKFGISINFLFVCLYNDDILLILCCDMLS